MVAPARPAAESADPLGRRPGEAGQSVPGDLAGLTPAPWPAVGVRMYAAPTPSGPVMVVPEGALADLRDTGYVLFSAPAPVRVDLLIAGPAVPGEPAPPVPFDEIEVVTLLRRAAAAATLAPDGASQRQAGVGPAGPWYATLLAWGWFLLLFAAQSPAHVIGALWLMAGLPAMRTGYRRRRQAWRRHGAAGLHAVAGAVAVRPLPHAGLTHLATILARDADDPSAALRAAAQACPDAGVAGLAPFYAALAAGAVPAGVWSSQTHQAPVVLASPAGEDAAPVPSAPPDPPGDAVGGETEGGEVRTSSTPT
jgi:hypothetical protein